MRERWAPSPRTLAEVVAAVDGAAPVSVALGDLPDLPHTAALAACGAAACGVDYVKLGLRGVRGLDRAVALVTAVADALAAARRLGVSREGRPAPARCDRRGVRGRRDRRSAGVRSGAAARAGRRGRGSRERSSTRCARTAGGCTGRCLRRRSLRLVDAHARGRRQLRRRGPAARRAARPRRGRHRRCALGRLPRR